MGTEAIISPQVIRWARDRINLTPEKLAKSTQTDATKVREWEIGTSRPTYNQARELARVLRIPFAYLYLSTPPREALPIPDLRILPHGDYQRPSAEFLDILNSAKRKQDWYREFLQYQSTQPLSFVGSFTTKDDPKELAAEMRRTLSVDDDLQSSSNSWSEFLTRLVRATEEVRILVFRSGIVGNNTHRKLDVEEFRGFALNDPIAPAVFVNARDAIAARTFTLAHELAHLWIGKSGISDVATDIDYRQIENDIERFCDHAAAEFLVPEDGFKRRWNEYSTELDQKIQSLARVYRVSTTMVLRRALELDKITRVDFYRQLEIEKGRQTPTARRSSGGNFQNSLTARNSSILVSAVFESVLEGRVLYREAASVLDVKPSTLSRLVEDSRIAR